MIEMKISVVGAGSWSTAMAKVLAQKGHEVTLCARKAEDAQKMSVQRENINHLAGVNLPENIRFSTFKDIPSSDVMVFGIPAQHVREVLSEIKFETKGIVNLAKGLEIKTLKRMEEVFKEFTNFNYATISGPSHAEEVAVEIPTSVVVSSRNDEFARLIQEEFSTNRFRLYLNKDLKGVEVGGSLKNVIAIAAGVLDGLGGWDNSKAAIITRGLAEITRIGVEMGAQQKTFMGLAGLGDLVVTCTSKHSRNRMIGEILGRGGTFSEKSAFVVEGAYTVIAELQLAKNLGVEVPIAQAVHSLIYKHASPFELIEKLMKRTLKEE
jgi:glycerol-3-phosphate dehydrogenase (NAD(P)+)